MTVKVNTGKAYVRNAAGSMAYRTNLDASVNATIANNASGNPRIDAVVIKLDLGATPNNLASNVASIVVVQGTPAASPSAPSDSAIQTAVGAGNPFYKLAEIAVANGATSITTSNITDKRSINSLSPTSTSGASVYLNANQSITNGVLTKVTFDTEAYDIGNEFASNKFTATTAGKYLATFTPILQSLTGGKILSAFIYKNGAAVVNETLHAGSNNNIGASLTAILNLAAGDYIEFYVIHDDTAAKNLSGGATGTVAMVQRLT